MIWLDALIKKIHAFLHIVEKAFLYFKKETSDEAKDSEQKE